MINIARHYLGADAADREHIRQYYNRHCAPLVSPNRTYRIQAGDEWCAAFVSVVAHKAGIRRDFPFEVSTFYQLMRWHDMGKAFISPSDALENDLVYFDWNGNGVPNHVGIVVSVQGDVLETIEGNKNNTVAFRKIDAHSSAVLGFVRVPVGYDAEDVETINAMAKAVIAGKYGKGRERELLLGDDYALVQRQVNRMLRQR